MNHKLTGNTRFRALPSNDRVLLVLQVEIEYFGSPLKSWRDAQLEDLHGKEAALRAEAAK